MLLPFVLVENFVFFSLSLFLLPLVVFSLLTAAGYTLDCWQSFHHQTLLRRNDETECVCCEKLATTWTTFDFDSPPLFLFFSFFYPLRSFYLGVFRRQHDSTPRFISLLLLLLFLASAGGIPPINSCLFFRVFLKQQTLKKTTNNQKMGGFGSANGRNGWKRTTGRFRRRFRSRPASWPASFGRTGLRWCPTGVMWSQRATGSRSHPGARSSSSHWVQTATRWRKKKQKLKKQQQQT